MYWTCCRTQNRNILVILRVEMQNTGNRRVLKILQNTENRNRLEILHVLSYCLIFSYKRSPDHDLGVILVMLE